MSKHRLFAITDFVCDRNFWETFCASDNVEYFVAGLEICPETQRNHLQAFIYFKHQRTLSSVIKKLKPRHVEICAGNINQNFKYCTKDNNVYYEFGSKPHQGKRNDILEIVEKFVPGNFDELMLENPQVYCQYNRGLEKLYTKSLKKAALNRKPPTIIVHWGPTGTGKTRTAVQAGAHIINYSNGFFSGYSGEKVICLDEFNPENMPRETFLRFTDRYYYELNVKGDYIPLCAETIYITSNISPLNWYARDPAVQRRINVNIPMRNPDLPGETDSDDEPYC